MNQNNKGFINIIVAIIIVFAVFILGYSVLNKKSEAPVINSDNQNQSTTTEANIPKGGPTQDGKCGDGACGYGENTPSYPYYCPKDCVEVTNPTNTTDWQTYQNDKYGFGFNYPKKELNEVPFQSSLFENLPFFQGNYNPNTYGRDSEQNRSRILDGIGLSHEIPTGKSESDTCYGEFSGLPQPCNSKITDTFFTFLIYNDKYENALNSILGSNQPYGKKTTISGRNGFFYDFGFEGSGQLYYFLPLNVSKTLVIVRYYRYEFDNKITSGEHGIYDQKLFSQILQTFKFTN